MVKYRFVKWSDGVTTRTRTVTLTSDLTLTAEYEAVTHTLTLNSTPINVQFQVDGQTIPSGGAIEIPEGTSVNITVPQEVTV